jgi:flagellar biogenesis protein FliO
MTRRPIVLLLCSVISGAIGVLVFAFNVPRKDGSTMPVGQQVLFFSSFGLVGLSIISVIIALIWLVVALVRKSSKKLPSVTRM